MKGMYERLLKARHFCFSLDKNAPIHLLFSQLFEVNAAPSSDQELISSCLLTRIVTGLLLQCPVQTDALPDWVQEICAYIEKNYHQAIRLDDLAEQFHMSKFHLCHSFRRFTGKTVMQYLLSVRMHHAEELLTYTKLSQTEIALLIGFENASSFSKAFRQYAGVTPGAYRRE